MKIVSFNKPVLFVKYLVYIALTFGITGTVGHKWDTLSIKLLQVLNCQKKKITCVVLAEEERMRGTCA